MYRDWGIRFLEKRGIPRMTSRVKVNAPVIVTSPRIRNLPSAFDPSPPEGAVGSSGATLTLTKALRDGSQLTYVLQKLQL